MGDGFRQLSLDLSRVGVDVAAIVPGPYSIDEFAHCRAVIHVDMPKSRPYTYIDPVRLTRIRKFFERTAPDVLFFYGPHPINLLIARMRGRSTRLAYWLHDPTPHSDGNPLFLKIYRHHDQWFLRHSDAIIVAFEEGRGTLIRAGVPPHRVHKIFLGFLENFSINDDPPVAHDFIFFGRLVEYKGLHVLAQALERLSSQGHSLSGIVAGPGNVRSVAPSLEERARTGQITLHERYVPDAELSALVASARVTVLPYLDATGTQTVQVAAYHRRPVLATRTGCFPEYVLDGRTGVIVPPADADALAAAMLKIKENPEWWNELGLEAHRLWFNGERSNLAQATRLAQALEQTCASPSRAQAENRTTRSDLTATM